MVNVAFLGGAVAARITDVFFFGEYLAEGVLDLFLDEM